MLRYKQSVSSSRVKKSKKNCLLKHVIGGKRGGTGRQRRRNKQLLDEFRARRRYCKFKEESLDRSLWRTSLCKRLWNCRTTKYAMNSGVILTWQVSSSNLFKESL